MSKVGPYLEKVASPEPRAELSRAAARSLKLLTIGTPGLTLTGQKPPSEGAPTGRAERSCRKPQKGPQKFARRSRSFGEIAKKGRKTFLVPFVPLEMTPFLRGVYHFMGFRAERLSARVSVLGRF